jgi:hypothetical protein
VKPISCARSALIVIVESTRSTVPSWMNGMRLSEIASTSSGSTPSLSATALPKSTSNPSTSPLCGFLKPNGGTSYFTPMRILPASWIRAIVEPAGNSSAAGVLSSAVEPPPPAGSSSSSPQAATPSASASASAVITARH